MAKWQPFLQPFGQETKNMKRHRNFEFYAGEYLKQNGYQIEVTQGGGRLGS